MPETLAEITSDVPPPTEEELAIMAELKGEQAWLLETTGYYQDRINCLYTVFEQTYMEDNYLRQENDNLRVELVKTAAKLGLETPEEYKCKQWMSTQAVESIDGVFPRILIKPGSQRIKSDVASAVFDFENFTGDYDSSLSARDMRTSAPDATVGGDSKSITPSTLEASGARSKAAPCTFAKTTESNLMKSAQSWKTDACNPSTQRSSKCMLVQQPAAKAAITGAAKRKTFPKLNSSTGTELMAGPMPKSSLMNDAVKPVNSSERKLDCVHGQVEAGKCSSQHLRPGCSCEDLSVASPPQNLEVLLRTSVDSQGKCSFDDKEQLHPHSALKTTGALSESSPLPSSSSSMGGVTTLVVRNIPTRYTKEMLLQEWVPDGTFDFFYLPFSFSQRRIAGYLFINFTSNEAALAFFSLWHNRSLHAQQVSTKLNITAAGVQGFEANVRHLINSKIKRIANPKYLPSVFDGVHEVPFSAYVEQLEAEQPVRLQNWSRDDFPPGASTSHSESRQSFPLCT